MSATSGRSPLAIDVLLVFLGSVFVILYAALFVGEGVGFVRPALGVGFLVVFGLAALVDRYHGQLAAAVERVSGPEQSRLERAIVVTGAVGFVAGRVLFVYLPKGVQTELLIGTLGVAAGLVVLGIGRAVVRSFVTD
ncbi:hypothetical protein BRD04_08635 [Halobacteriales archaeon QS_9_67_17]|nr:MAG: hypothetical protein BRD04_08635 [Halobacteriales archaeon QS_9_67_17]